MIYLVALAAIAFIVLRSRRYRPPPLQRLRAASPDSWGIAAALQWGELRREPSVSRPKLRKGWSETL